MNQEALAQARKVESLLVGAGSPSYRGGLGHLYGTVGQRTEALCIYIGLGERKTALDLLEKA